MNGGGGGRTWKDYLVRLEGREEVKAEQHVRDRHALAWIPTGKSRRETCEGGGMQESAEPSVRRGEGKGFRGASLGGLGHETRGGLTTSGASL